MHGFIPVIDNIFKKIIILFRANKNIFVNFVDNIDIPKQKYFSNQNIII
jgi:hypothetical protein